MTASSIAKKIAPALMALLLTACSNDPAPQPTPLAITPEIFTVTVIVPTDTPLPTPTALPLAARVNEQPITLAQFNDEMARYIEAMPNAPDPKSDEGQALAARLKEQVLDALIEQTLIAQAASKDGVSVSDAQVNDEISVAQDRAGGADKFTAWLQANRMSELDVRAMAQQELLINMMRDRVLAQLPRTAEYIHVYHIVVGTEREAQQVLQKLQNGAKFSALAQTLSIDESTRVEGGDLGWITRNSGALLWSEVEDAAFALPVGETSDIVKSPIGYHVIRVTEKEERPLTEADTAQLQEAALQNWIAQLRAGAKIERFI
jgi:parvulin-like peptidyl-prolyl isomerase